MKKFFKEYHQFTKKEFQQLWKSCLFVLDTNTLLNMYRYSRETVTAYFNVLNELKKKEQLWIPYQVGHEFYENRINIISEYEKSYDDILKIIEKAKSDIEAKYTNHPFLDLAKIREKMNRGLSGVVKEIEQAKEDHPKWLEKDEVLEKLNQLFEGNIGNNYDEQKLNKIIEEGKERYEKKIPPGFKDDAKSENKYGDLILWYQIIDKAQESKKSIVLISGDIKEDWWLEKDGKRLMPLPQLKKEISDKAKVDFHIYTADRFLEFYNKDKKGIADRTIEEVREIRKLEEQRMLIRRMELIDREGEMVHKYDRYSLEYLNLFDRLEGLMMKIIESNIDPNKKKDLGYLFRSLRDVRDKITHGRASKIFFHRFYRYSKEISLILVNIIDTEEISHELSMTIREYVSRAKYINKRVIGNLE